MRVRKNYDIGFIIKAAVGFLVILWLLGVINLPILNTPLFHVFGRAFTVSHLVTLLFFGYILKFLPGLVQTIVAILLCIWLLSIFVFPAVGGLFSIVLVILVLYLLFSFIF